MTKASTGERVPSISFYQLTGYSDYLNLGGRPAQNLVYYHLPVAKIPYCMESTAQVPFTLRPRRNHGHSCFLCEIVIRSPAAANKARKEAELAAATAEQ